MNLSIEDIIGLVLVALIIVAFVVVWIVLHYRVHSRMKSNAFGGAGLGLDQLTAMANKLTPEEYNKIQNALVSKVADDIDGKKAAERNSRDASLLGLEAELRREEMDKYSRD